MELMTSVRPGPGLNWSPLSDGCGSYTGAGEAARSGAHERISGAASWQEQ